MLRKLFSSILLIAAVVIGFGAFGHASEARQLHDAIGPFLISRTSPGRSTSRLVLRQWMLAGLRRSNLLELVSLPAS